MRYSALAFVGLILVAGLVLFSQLMADDEILARRRERLKSMSDVEKTRLLEKKQRFDALSPAEQDRYRALHGELVNDPQYEELRDTLQRYHDWFKTISSGERAELATLSPRERLTRVRELMDEQAADRFRMMVSEVIKSKQLLSRQDMSVVCEWTDEFLLRHAEEILAALPDDSRLAEMKERFDPERHLHGLRFLYLRRGSSQLRGTRTGSDAAPHVPPRPRKLPAEDGRSAKVVRNSPAAAHDRLDRFPDPSAEEIADLKRRVSQPARDVLEKATEEGQELRIVQNWIRAAFLSRMMPPVNLADLDRFVREESLTKDEREWLESLPRERMYHELRKLYFRERFHRERWEKGWGRLRRKGRVNASRQHSSQEEEPRNEKGGPFWEKMRPPGRPPKQQRNETSQRRVRAPRDR